MYWATVWAEDANGVVLPEILGHGLDTSTTPVFDPFTSYGFITDVPLEMVDNNSATYSNNVGMFKKLFAIVETG